MKRIILAIAAITAIAACTKSEVTYEAPGEIGFAPVTGNITKASGIEGDLDEEQELGIYAFWDKDLVLQGTNYVEVGDKYGDYDEDYLVNAQFVHKNGSWGGQGNGYPWPTNGALVFAGYTTPGSENSYDVTYSLFDNAVTTDVDEADMMTFTNYDNEPEFDLCWFGRTQYSYNNRIDSAPITVKLSHALSWITIAAYAEGSAVGWTIKSMEWEVPTSGTAECVGTTATWKSLTPGVAKDILVNNAGAYIDHTLTAGTTSDGKTTGDTITNNLVIPTRPVDLKITYTFLVNGAEMEDSKIVSLKLDNGNTLDWVSGVHYTYTLKFAANEILVAPSYGDWVPEDKGVTVE